MLGQRRKRVFRVAMLGILCYYQKYRLQIIYEILIAMYTEGYNTLMSQ